MGGLSDRAVGVIGIVVFILALVGLWFWRVAPDDASDQPSGSPTRWQSITTDADHLTVRYDGSACQKSNDLVVEEHDDQVVVTLFVDIAPGMCTAQAVGYDVTARLAAPLGDRVVLDGACLDEVGADSDTECVRVPRSTSP